MIHDKNNPNDNIPSDDEYEDIKHITEADDPEEIIEALGAQSGLYVVSEDENGNIREIG